MRKSIMTGISAVLVMSLLAGCGTVEDTDRDSRLRELESEQKINVQTDNTEDTEDIQEEKKPIEIVEDTFDMSQGVIPKVYIEQPTGAGEISREEYTPATIRVVDETCQYADIEASNAKIKVRGHSTANGRKKPYNFKFETKTNVLGMGESKKWNLIANLYDPTQLRNKLVFEFARNIGMEYTSNTQFVEVYLNGEYKGLYLLTEPVEEGKDKVDINVDNNEYLLELQPNAEKTDDVTFLTYRGNYFSVKDGKDDNLTYIMNLLNNFEYSFEKDYEEMSKYADLDTFVDYYILSELFKDVDFATTSSFFYVKDGMIYAGPVWDYDLSMGNAGTYYQEYNNASTLEDSTEEFYCQKYWFYFLTQNEKFMTKVRQRFEEMQPLIENLTTDNEMGKNRIDVLTMTYGEFFEKNAKLWNVGTEYSIEGMQRLPDATYKENVDYLRNWLIKRNEWLKSQWS